MAALGLKVPDRRESLRVHLIGESAPGLAEVKAVVGEIGEPRLDVVEMSPQAAVDDTEVADIAMVLFDGNEAAPLGYLQSRAERLPRPIIFALLQDRSPALMRRVLYEGADDLLFLPLQSADLTRALMKLSERRRRAERQAGGLIYGVASIVGGGGREHPQCQPGAGHALRIWQAGGGS